MVADTGCTGKTGVFSHDLGQQYISLGARYPTHSTIWPCVPHQVLPKPAGDSAASKKDAKGGAAKRKDAPGGAAAKAVAKKGKSGVGGGKK